MRVRTTALVGVRVPSLVELRPAKGNRAVELTQPPPTPIAHREAGHADRLPRLRSGPGEHNVPERGEADGVFRLVKRDDLRPIPAQLARLADHGLEVTPDSSPVA